MNGYRRNGSLTFDDFESRERAFRDLTGIACPVLTGGSILAEMEAWRAANGGTRRQAIIPSNPSLGLVFATTHEELTTAVARNKRRENKMSIAEVMALFNLPQTKSLQSIRTLSTGEKALVALAKCFLLAAENRSLIVCDPSQCLSLDNRHHLRTVVDEQDRVRGHWNVLSLEGETGLGTAEGALHVFDGVDRVAFRGPELTLRLDALKVALEDQTGLSKAPPLHITYETRGPSGAKILRLRSPILWVAPNGIGKSTLVHILVEALHDVSGEAKLSVEGKEGLARALFQDCVPQLFGKSPSDYLEWSLRESAASHARAEEECSLLEEKIYGRVKRYFPSTLGRSQGETMTLLHAKIALVAARLQPQTSLLILDEPGTGLGRSAATFFLEAIAERCADLRIALLIISHVPQWYEHVAESHLTIDDMAENPVSGRQLVLGGKAAKPL